MTLIGRRVAAWRFAAGLSQVELGRRSGLCHSAISRIEGGRQQPTAAQLESIAGAMKLSMVAFYGRVVLAEAAAAPTSKRGRQPRTERRHG